jgi:UDP-N-acetylglucosamine diphosphorylase/glucosamine-1-phosphate N-acetyltransferase
MIILFEDKDVAHFYPLALTRPMSELRMGVLKNSERWGMATAFKVSHTTRDYLKPLYPESKKDEGFLINARLLPSAEVWETIKELPAGHMLMHQQHVLAFHYSPEYTSFDQVIQKVDFPTKPLFLEKITDLFALNAEAIKLDFKLVTQGRHSAALPDHCRIIGNADRLFIEEGATVLCSTFNVTEGPIYIAKDAEVMEGSLVRGPFVLGKHSQLKMGTKVYTGTSIGPHCKVGGEISNSLIMGFSNKAHDGFLGNSILGEWCNLGADTNNSNLKNNYSNVRIWNYADKSYADTGLTFCGLIMGDHSKCGINTMFNTGTVVGVSANIFGGGFPPKHIPSFGWGGSEGLSTYDLNKAFATAAKVFGRRSLEFDQANRDMLSAIYEMTISDREMAGKDQGE